MGGERGRPHIDIGGQRFGSLVAVSPLLGRPRDPTAHGVKWLCDCDCGAQVDVCSHCLRAGRATSCTDLPRSRAERQARQQDPDQWFWIHVDGWSVDDCWEWQGGRHQTGYGYVCGLGERWKWAHRAAWQLLRGEIPDDLCIDHLCRNRACVNPWHMELVSIAENVRRGVPYRLPTHSQRKAPLPTHCKRGHELNGDNVRIITMRGRAVRSCQECRRTRERLRRREESDLRQRQLAAWALTYMDAS